MLIEDFSDIFLWGEVKEDKGEFYYIYETSSSDEDIDDMLWDTYCQDMNSIREKYPDFEYANSWQDNDSAGCDIIRI